MERQILTHVVQGDTLNEQLAIFAKDVPGKGGANHVYKIGDLTLEFQIGNPKAGVNGISDEALLAIVIDRLKGFENGPFREINTTSARVRCEQALKYLQKRTTERLSRGVLGEMKP